MNAKVWMAILIIFVMISSVFGFIFGFGGGGGGAGPTQVTLDGSCVKLNGHEFDLLKTVDRLLFQWYKIII